MKFSKATIEVVKMNSSDMMITTCSAFEDPCPNDTGEFA